MPDAKLEVTVRLTADKVGFDSFEIQAKNLPPNREYTVFLLETAGAPFGAAEYIGDFSTNPAGNGQNTFKLIVQEAFSSTLVNGARVRVDLNRVGVWFADPKDDDFCPAAIGVNGVTPFDGDNAGWRAGFQLGERRSAAHSVACAIASGDGGRRTADEHERSGCTMRWCIRYPAVPRGQVGHGADRDRAGPHPGQRPLARGDVRDRHRHPGGDVRPGPADPLPGHRPGRARHRARDRLARAGDGGGAAGGRDGRGDVEPGDGRGRRLHRRDRADLHPRAAAAARALAPQAAPSGRPGSAPVDAAADR